MNDAPLADGDAAVPRMVAETDLRAGHLQPAHRELLDVLVAVMLDRPDMANEALSRAEWMAPEVAEQIAELVSAPAEGGDPRARRSATAERIGDVLRAAQDEPGLDADIIECYRAAFYFGDSWEKLATNPLYARFLANKAGLPFDKWLHYFEVYQRVLAPYVGRPVRVLEIGVFHGGGLEQLRALLGPEAVLVGADIDPAAKAACAGRFDVMVGDQTDPEFLASIVEEHGPFDVIIDDGGHFVNQQIVAIEYLFPTLRDGGLYLVEDTHTSYWPHYQDADESFMEWAKRRVDDVNAYHFSDKRDLDIWATHVTGLHFYDSIVVFEKARHLPPFCEVNGTGSFLFGDRNSQLALLTYRAALGLQSAETEREVAHATEVAREAIAANEVAQQAFRDVTESSVWRLTEPWRNWRERRGHKK